MSQRKRPEISPYVFPVLLAGFGLWCVYDGWLSASPEIQKHLLFNRVTGAVLSVWALVDFRRLRRRERASAAQQPESASDDRHQS